MMSTAHATAQIPAGTVHLIPPVSSVDTGAGAFSIFVVLEDFQHVGIISYDDNRDTVSDRNVESPGLAAFEIILAFDESVLAVDDVEPGPIFDEAGRTFQCLPPQEEPGGIRFGCLSTGSQEGIQGSFTLASIEVRPLRAGSSQLHLETGVSGPLGNSVPVSVTGGLVRVTDLPSAKATGNPTRLPPTATQGDSAQATTQPPLASATSDMVSPATATLTPAETAVNPQATDPADGDPEAGSKTGGSSSSQPEFRIAIVAGGVLAAGALVLGFVLLRRRTGT